MFSDSKSLKVESDSDEETKNFVTYEQLATVHLAQKMMIDMIFALIDHFYVHLHFLKIKLITQKNLVVKS